MSASRVRAIQRYYPQIYLACHVDHVRTKSNRHHVSAHDATPLAHLDENTPVLAGRLAPHLGVASSTLSASLKRLASLGLLTRTPAELARRRTELRLTAKGAEAMAATSVLDTKRLTAMLAELSPVDRERAVGGLVLLASASRDFQAKAPRSKRW